MHIRRQFISTAVVVLLLLPAISVAQDSVFRLKSAGGSSKVNGKISATSPDFVTISGQQIPNSEIKRLFFAKEPVNLNRAREQMQSGQFADSIEELNKIKDSVKSPMIQTEIDFIRAYASAQISLRGGNITPNSAGQQIRTFMQKNPNSIHLYRATETFGKLAFAVGKPDLAAGEFAKLANVPWTEFKMKGLFQKGQMDIVQGKLNDAKAAFNAIGKIDATDDVSQVYKLLAKSGLAQVRGLGGDVAGAKASLEDMIKKENPDNKKLFAHIYNALGSIHVKANNTQQAAMSYLKTELLMASESEAHAEALYNLALLWPKLEKTDRANSARDILKSRYRNSYWASKL